MLKQRIITAAIVAPLVIWATLGLGSLWFAVVAATIFTLGAWEWATLSGLDGYASVGYAAAVAGVFALAYRWTDTADLAMGAAIGAGLLWWLIALVFVWRFPRDSNLWQGSRPMRLLAGMLVLIPSWIALIALHRLAGPGFALLVIVLVSTADIGAFFAGRRFGLHKLAPRVSPGKTWEGVGGALGATLVTSAVGAWLLGVPHALAGLFILLSLVAVAFSVVGDLAESMFKRLVGAKDSSGLLPGHGGILDRIDSLTAAAPVFAAGVYFLGVGL